MSTSPEKNEGSKPEKKKKNQSRPEKNKSQFQAFHRAGCHRS